MERFMLTVDISTSSYYTLDGFFKLEKSAVRLSY